MLNTLNFEKRNTKKFSFKLFTFLLFAYTLTANLPSISLWEKQEKDEELLAKRLEIFTNSMNQVNERFTDLEKFYEQLQDTQMRLQNVRNNLEAAKVASDQCNTNAERVTKKLQEDIASIIEVLSFQSENLQKRDLALDEYQKLVENEDKQKELHKKRLERFYDGLYSVFYEFNVQDPVITKIFDEACEISPEFTELFEHIKAGPKIVQAIRTIVKQLETLFFDLLEERKEWRELMDQPIQLELAIGDGSTEQPAIGGAENVKGLGNVDNTDDTPESELKEDL